MTASHKQGPCTKAQKLAVQSSRSLYINSPMHYGLSLSRVSHKIFVREGITVGLHNSYTNVSNFENNWACVPQNKRIMPVTGTAYNYHSVTTLLSCS